MKSRNFLITLILVAFWACSSKPGNDLTLFTLIDNKQMGIDFRNDLSYSERFNPYTFRNFYNGAGVALGDINNDGLIDIFLAGNQTSNKLYLNKGNFQFEDITELAGLNSDGLWTTGVSMADVNGDGLLDIYVCKSGPLEGDDRHNALYINQGDLTFKEMAKEYGIADKGLSQHAVFFDYDKDGDLDMYLLSNSTRSIGAYDLKEGQREVRDPLGGNKLYRNDGSYFTDVSEEAGIYGSAIGYGLGVTVADLDADGWPDLYVSNDFFERDYLYLNNQDGTFREVLEELMTEISMGSMGADIADLDNDGWQDIFVTEMLPATLDRVKTKTPFEDWDKYQANVKAGYFHQFTRNTLQRNLGFKPNSNEVHFVDISRIAGVNATDWSWGALIFDADNDGLRDIFVANGIVKDLTDFDFVDYFVNNQNLIGQQKRDSVLLTNLIDQFPSVPLQNYLFQNQGKFHFENIAGSSGMSQLTFSTGAAYADLDNDGDLDLVVNNLQNEVFIYRNNSSEINNNHFLSIDLKGQFGAKVWLYAGGQSFLSEYNPVKGYMSSVDPRLHFGLGKVSKIDSIHVLWPSGEFDKFGSFESNQFIHFEPTENFDEFPDLRKPVQPFLKTAENQVDWQHRESEFIDFDRDRLRFRMISNEGPKVAVGDLNADGLDDLVFTGAKGQPSSVYLQRADGSFFLHQSFNEDALAEDVDAVLFDANGNGYMDLILAAGSIEMSFGHPSYQDRLYLNDGKGNFKKAIEQIPIRNQSTAFIKTLDYNADGHLDLLVGTRSIPFAYGMPGDVLIWENDGTGSFKDVTDQVSRGFRQLGMCRDAAVLDLDGDGMDEIVLVGDWMPIKVFKKINGIYQDHSAEFGTEMTGGWWNTLHVTDIDSDGLPDLIFGNHGLNSRFSASRDKPMRLYVNDFDQNGSIEQILTQYEGLESYPLLLKNTLVRQIPELRKKLLTYDAYKDKTISDLFSSSIIQNSKILEIHELASVAYRNLGEGRFEKQPLPAEALYSPIYAIESFKDQDGNQHLLIGGNQSRIKPEMGIQMGSFGWHFQVDKKGEWKLHPSDKSGFFVEGEIRDIKTVRTNKGEVLLVCRNNDHPIIFSIP